MIQFDKVFYLVFLDVNYRICIFMNIYKNLKNGLSGMQFSHLSIHEYLRKPEKQRENSGKMGYTTQLLIALVYKTGTKLMLRQSSSTLVNFVNYLIVISININENCRSKRKFVKRKNRKKGEINSYLRIVLPACTTF